MLNTPSTRFPALEGSHHFVSSRPFQILHSQLEDFFDYGREPSNGILVRELGRSHNKKELVRRSVWQKKNGAWSSLYLRKGVASGTRSNCRAAEMSCGGESGAIT